MLYAQFYIERNGKLIEPCGDRAVIILDARYRPETNTQIAREECEKRGFVAWSIHRGQFLNSKKVSGPWRIPGKDDKTAFSAYYGA